MASRSLSELLLRPSTFPRIPQAQTSRRIIPWPTQRPISTTARQQAQPAQNDGDDYIPEAEAQRPRARYIPEREAAAPPSQDQTSQTINALFSRGLSSNRSPAPYMPRNAVPDSAANAARVFGAEFSDNTRRRPAGRRNGGLDFESMDMPDSIMNPTLANKPSDASSLAAQQEETFSAYPRLNPAYGRTVDLDVSRGRDIVRGIGMLGSLMARNKVKNDFNRQRFHERGGLKRKRLASERWRARFKTGFREVTGRVSELTRKGW